MEYITGRIDEAQGQLVDLNDEEPIVTINDISKAELIYLFEKVVPFFVNGQAMINAEKRHVTGSYQKAKTELETKGKPAYKPFGC